MVAYGAPDSLLICVEYNGRKERIGRPTMSEIKSGSYERGIYRQGDVRISDLSGRKMLPIGNDVFTTCVTNSVFIDKSLLIADVLDSGFTATLFCRPRRFGKSLNLSMLQYFFEIPSKSDPAALDAMPLFEGLAIWEADGGRYREHFAAYPVIYLSLKTLKSVSAERFFEDIAVVMAEEYQRHYYLLDSEKISDSQKETFQRLLNREAARADLAGSLKLLSDLLFQHHGARTVILIDEYDAPIMAAYTNGFYREVVDFIKMWLTSALKSSKSLELACLTGVQRISKESIFSDLNNLIVDTPLDVRSDERYGFTDEEVAALAEYLGDEASLDDVRHWYDGYRFGNVDVYNPWSVLNYFKAHCVADVYWGNTSGNGVLGDMVHNASERVLSQLYQLMEPGGTVEQPLDLGVVFPDIGIRPGTVWSMLYLSGYLTTNDTQLPNNARIPRALRIPNQEIAELFRGEIVERFANVAGDTERLYDLHRALVAGGGEAVEAELSHILLNSASYFDLTSENSYHMLVMGLLFGIPGYEDPLSNREAGRGRYDIRLSPLNGVAKPLITLELKCADRQGNVENELSNLVETALAQIVNQVYDADASGAVIRYGIAFAGKHVAVAVRV